MGRQVVALVSHKLSVAGPKGFSALSLLTSHHTLSYLRSISALRVPLF